MTPDEPTSSDVTAEVDGIVFCMEQAIADQIPGDVTIDYRESGLRRGFSVVL